MIFLILSFFKYLQTYQFLYFASNDILLFYSERAIWMWYLNANFYMYYFKKIIHLDFEVPQLLLNYFNVETDHIFFDAYTLRVLYDMYIAL